MRIAMLNRLEKMRETKARKRAEAIARGELVPKQKRTSSKRKAKDKEKLSDKATKKAKEDSLSDVEEETKKKKASSGGGKEEEVRSVSAKVKPETRKSATAAAIVNDKNEMEVEESGSAVEEEKQAPKKKQQAKRKKSDVTDLTSATESSEPEVDMPPEGKRNSKKTNATPKRNRKKLKQTASIGGSEKGEREESALAFSDEYKRPDSLRRWVIELQVDVSMTAAKDVVVARTVLHAVDGEHFELEGEDGIRNFFALKEANMLEEDMKADVALIEKDWPFPSLEDCLSILHPNVRYDRIIFYPDVHRETAKE